MGECQPFFSDANRSFFGNHRIHSSSSLVGTIFFIGISIRK